MANENIQISDSNFCLGPQAGTICTIDTTNPQTVLRVKDTGGSTIIDLSLSSNMLNSNVRLEYVGPKNLSTMLDDLTFFTFERVNSSSCIIKRWKTRMAYRELLLREQIVKSTTGNERYNAIDFAVEYYHRSFTKPNEYYNYLDMDSVVNVKSGTKFFLGPSTDTTNLGATETAVVSHIISYIGGTRVYLTAPLNYQYAVGDTITFYSHAYIYSSEGYAGDPNKGTLFKIDAYNWSTREIDTKTIYKRVTASRWCPMIGGIASVIGTNSLFVRPYDSYLNWRSMFLNNVASDNNTVFSVYDLIFDEYSVYKLQLKTTLRDDDGNKTTSSWSKYNFQEDTLLPYSSSMVTWMDQSILTGYNKNVDINTQVRDQFHVGLRDVYVNFYKQGDPDALFDPLNGALTTDLNGKGVMNYRSGSVYNGHTEITTKAAGGSAASTGSSYVWTSNNIISFPDFAPVYKRLEQLKYIDDSVGLKHIFPMFKVLPSGESEWRYPTVFLYAKTFFTSPGGDWGSGSGFLNPGEVETWLPMLYLGVDQQSDAPKGGGGYGFTNWPYSSLGEETPFFIGNQIKLFEQLTVEHKIKCLTYYLLYPQNGDEDDGYVPYTTVKQPDETGHGQISQLNLSLHTHWVDGVPYDYLWTYVNLDQFVFVEDAIPKFWSEKNPIDTNIWLRLRPFAFSLDNNSLRMWVREESYLGDTGYYEVTDDVVLVNFDAGGGILGIEATYNPPTDFLYGSIVYVRIEMYDIAYIPNFLYLAYWFKVTPDYKIPYLTNLYPDRGDMNLPVDSSVYFEIKDRGTGINLDSLECFINSRRMESSYLNVEVVSIYHIKVTYTPPEALYFDKDYKITVKVQDTSPNENRMNDSYIFYTTSSTGVLITDETPAICKRGMSRFQDVSVLVLADGNGVDAGSIRMQVFNKDTDPKILPVLYRIS